MSVIVHHDARTPFERAWAHGLAAGILTEEIQAAVLKDGTRAILKLADILGTRALRSDLERAMRAMLGLVNLHLTQVSAGNPAAAARSLADHGLLFHTRGASQAIKRILAIEDGRDPDAMSAAELAAYETQVLTFPYAQFEDRQREARARATLHAAAHALAERLDVESPDDLLLDHGPEAVVMTALLALTWMKTPAWPRSPRELEHLFAAVRKSPKKLAKLPATVPNEHVDAVERVRTAHASKVLAGITDASIDLHLLVDPGFARNPLLGHIAFAEHAIDDVDDLSATTTRHWQTLTGGATDDARLLTVMLRAVPGFDAAVKIPMTLTAAVELLRTRFASRPEDEPLLRWLELNAPHERHADLEALWHDFWDAREALGEDAGVERVRGFAREWLPVKVAGGRRGVGS